MTKKEYLTENESWWLCTRDTFYIYKRVDSDGTNVLFWSGKSVDDVKKEADIIYKYSPVQHKEMLEYYSNCYLKVQYKSSNLEERLAGIKFLNSQMKKAELKDDFE